MPLSCVAYGCTNHNIPNAEKHPEMRQRWIHACKRKNTDGTDWNPKGPNVYICDEHFITGKPDRKDSNHLDYVPSIFTFSRSSKKQNENKVKRFACSKKRKILAEFPPCSIRKNGINGETNKPNDESETTQLLCDSEPNADEDADQLLDNVNDNSFLSESVSL